MNLGGFNMRSEFMAKILMLQNMTIYFESKLFGGVRKEPFLSSMN